MNTLLSSDYSADDSRPWSFVPNTWPPEDLLAEGILTNDLVALCGGLASRTVRRLRVSGAPPIYLDRRQFLVLLVLACHRLTLEGRPTPFELDGAAFLHSVDILAAIDKIQASEGAAPGVLASGIAPDIARVVHQIRAKLEAYRINPSLIETGPKGAGYRLSTLAKNVLVYFIRAGQFC